MDNSGGPGKMGDDVSGGPSDRTRSKKRVITAARKEQNRLAQRTYRRKQRELKGALEQSAPLTLRRLAPRRSIAEGPNEQSCLSGQRQNTDLTRLHPAATSSSNSLPLGGIEEVLASDPNTTEPQARTTYQHLTCESLTLPAPSDEHNVISTALATATPIGRVNSDAQSYGNTHPSIGRGLEDISTNVFRACVSNAICLGIDIAELMYCTKPYMSTFYKPTAHMNDDPAALIAASSHDALPASLRPTLAQILIPHHASLDLIPLPRLRERAILMCAAMPHIFSLWELKLDIYTRNALICQEHNTTSGPVSQPWDMHSWRATPWFRSKWRMVIDSDEIGAIGTDLSLPGIPGLWI